MVAEKGIPESQFAANRGIVAWLRGGRRAHLPLPGKRGDDFALEWLVRLRALR